MNQSHHHRRRLGFSLIELMIAMAIGLFGTIIVTQVFTMSEQNKRTTSSGDDAMNEGAISLYSMHREISMGGYGIADIKIFGCNVLLPSGVTLVALAPVTINHVSIPAGDANTDTVMVAYSQTDGSPQGTNITANGVADQYSLQTTMAFAVNDYVLAAPATRSCATSTASLTPSLPLSKVTAIANPNVTVTVGSGLPTSTVVAPDYPSLFNFGQNSPTVLVYAVRNKSLTVCDYIAKDCGAAANKSDPTVWVPIGSNIVSLRAQYGRDMAVAGVMDGVVDGYDQTTPVGATTIACNVARISAVRLAVVAQSVQAAVGATSAAPNWDGSDTTPIDLTANADWQNYRYKVFQTVVHLRNVSWMGKVSGC